MSDQGKSIPFDLTRYTEATRRALYDAVVADIWTPRDPGDNVPTYTPDAAQLTVLYMQGRWLVLWTDLEEPETAPPEQRLVMSRIMADKDRPFGIQLSEV